MNLVSSNEDDRKVKMSFGPKLIGQLMSLGILMLFLPGQVS